MMHALVTIIASLITLSTTAVASPNGSSVDRLISGGLQNTQNQIAATLSDLRTLERLKLQREKNWFMSGSKCIDISSAAVESSASHLRQAADLNEAFIANIESTRDRLSTPADVSRFNRVVGARNKLSDLGDVFIGALSNRANWTQLLSKAIDDGTVCDETDKLIATSIANNQKMLNMFRLLSIDLQSVR